jgi:hypothetical protein
MSPDKVPPNRPDEPPELPEFPDMKRIDTPGRALTLGQLYDFWDEREELGEIGPTAQRLMAAEENVAVYAYQQALYGHDEETAQKRRHWKQKAIDDLAELYIELGLATKHQAAEIIRRIEAQAVAQVPGRRRE